MNAWISRARIVSKGMGQNLLAKHKGKRVCFASVLFGHLVALRTPKGSGGCGALKDEVGSQETRAWKEELL